MKLLAFVLTLTTLAACIKLPAIHDNKALLNIHSEFFKLLLINN